MSREAEKWAKGEGLRGFEHIVLGILAKHHSPRWGLSKVTQKEIAIEAGISRQSVSSILKRLEDKGRIKAEIQGRVKGQWDRVHYRLNPNNGGIQQPKREPRKSRSRVNLPDTAPCKLDITRHRVNLHDTSRADDTSRARSLHAPELKLVSGGGAS